MWCFVFLDQDSLLPEAMFLQVARATVESAGNCNECENPNPGGGKPRGKLASGKTEKEEYDEMVPVLFYPHYVGSWEQSFLFLTNR